MNTGSTAVAVLASAGAACFWTQRAAAAVLHVGPGQAYTTIASAVAASSDGDEVQVQAGTYTNDFAEIATRISLTAIGGRVVMQATGDIPNRKAILITDTDVTITGFTFTGARVTQDDGQNGAGIRYQGGNLVIKRCWFTRNQEGLLADADPTGTMLIDDSEFSLNGDTTGPGAGYTHNLYVGAIAKLDVEGSYFHHAHLGHEIKSRATQTVINNTRIVDGPTGTASYSVDLPNGGIATIAGSQIEQGPKSANPAIISYGEEGSIIANSTLTVRTTLLENDLTEHTPVGVVNATTVMASLANDQTYGLTTAQLASGPASLRNITPLASEPAISARHPWLAGSRPSIMPMRDDRAGAARAPVTAPSSTSVRAGP